MNVTDEMVGAACAAYHKASDYMGPAPRKDWMRTALVAATSPQPACPRDCGCIVHCRREQVRQAGLLESTPLLPSAADEPVECIAGRINGYLPNARAVEFKADDQLPEWVNSYGVRAFLTTTRPASARPSAGAGDTLRTLLAERGHRTDGDMQALADRCLHLSRGDRDLIVIRGTEMASRTPVAPAAEGDK